MKTEQLKQMRIGVLMGGPSSERAVSLETGRGVHAALAALGYDCVAIDWQAEGDLCRVLADERIDVVWNALHGTYGEDGAVQGLLTCLRIPFTGSGILSSALAMDKIASKQAFEAHAILTPRWAVLPAEGDAHEVLAAWKVPLVIKPAREGSSVGVSVVQNRDDVPGALERARACGGPVLVEEYIAGPELHVGVLDDAVIGSVEVRPAKGFYDYDAKYERDDTEYLVPPQVDAEVLSRAETVAGAAHAALGCGSYSRVDIRVAETDGQPYVLEVNTLPGMTSHSLMPKIAAEVGLDYGALCERILLAVARGL